MQFNTQAARAAGYTDEEIAAYLAQEQKFNLQGALQSGYSPSEIINFLSPPAAPPEKTGVLRAAADIPVQVGRGLVQGVKALSDVFGADNPVSRSASGVEGYLGELLSAQAKNDQAEIARIMKEAEDKGVGANLVAAAKAIATAPADTLAQVFGTAVPVIAGGLVGSLTRLGASAARYGIGVTMGAGGVKGAIYEAVKQELKANNVPEAEAERRAQEAQAYGGENIEQILLGAGLGAAASRGAERIITDLLKKGAMKPSALPAATRIPTAAITEAVPEAAQAAQERIAQNIALQREGFDVPTMRGVAGQAAFEGLAGAGLGGIAGAVQRREAPTPEAPAPVAEPEKPAPVAEALEPETGETGIATPEAEVSVGREVEKVAEPTIAQTKTAEIAPAEAKAEIAPTPTAPPVAPNYANMTLGELQSARDNADKTNMEMDLFAINKHFGPEVATAYQGMNRRQRNKWWDENATDAFERDSSVFKGVNEETINEYVKAYNNFDTESAKELGRSISLIARKINDPDFMGSPEYLTLKNALSYAKEKGWSEKEVLDAMRSRATEWAGANAQELFKDLFKPVSKQETGAAPGVAEDRRLTQPVTEAPKPVEAKKGAETKIITPDGQQIPAQWEVVEADAVSAAMTEGKTQPRDRKRAASNAQIQSIAQNPDFDRLSDTSQTMDYGAPTLTEDYAIVGGNGRFEGVNLAYDGEPGQQYKKRLLENADRLGLSAEQIAGMQKPVLVRRITQPVDTRKIAIQSNITAGLALSDMEQAALDAERMTGLDRLSITDTGDIPLTAGNMDVVRNALKDYTTEEASGMMSAEGGLSQAGLRRVKNAILYKAYGKTDTLARLIESPDPDLKNVGTALMRAAGNMSRMMDGIRDGSIPAEYNIVEDLTGAIETLSALRNSGTKVQEFLAQTDMFGGGISGPGRAIIRFIDNNLRSAKSITEFLNDYAQAVLSAESAKGGLFEETKLPTKQETVERAAQKYEAQREAAKAQRTLEEQPTGEVRPEGRVEPEGEKRAAVSDEEAAKLNKQQAKDAGTPANVTEAMDEYAFGEQVGAKPVFETKVKGEKAVATMELRQKSNKELANSVAEGDVYGVIDQLVASKNPIISKIGKLASKRPYFGIGLKTSFPGMRWPAHAAGAYSPTNRIAAFLKKYADREHVVAHEIVHYLTYDAIHNPTEAQKPAVQRLQKLFSHVKQNIGADGQKLYGLTNLDEFVAEANSNVNFQYKLRQIKYQNQTAWGAFTKYVAQLLGLGNDTALTEVIALTEELASPESRTTVAPPGVVLAMKPDEETYRGAIGKETPPTPTTAGQAALNTINQLGMGVKAPEERRIDKVKTKLKQLGEAPVKDTAKEWKQTASDFLAKIDGSIFSADAPFENKLRQGFREDFKNIKDFVGALLKVSQSQAVAADAVSTRGMLIGKVEYRDDLHKWVAVEDKANEINKARILDGIAKKYGLTKEEAVRVAHTYLSAANYEGILKRNAALEKKIKELKKEQKQLLSGAEGDLPDKNKQARLNELKAEISRLDAADVFVTEEQAAMVEPGLSIADQIPEVKEITTLWNKQRENVKNTMVETGLWTPEYADAMMDNSAYVPFYREMEEEADANPEMMIRGMQVKAKEHKLKGSEAAVADVFENMARWQQYAINRAIRNHKALQMIDAATEMKIGDTTMARKVGEAERNKNVVRVWRDGKQEFYEMADPLFMDAFKSLGAVSIPTIKYFTKIANMLRESIVLYPMFSLGQVPQDAVAAIFASGLQPKFAFKIPYLAVKEFIKTMRGTSNLHKELRDFGAVGVRDFNAAVSREDAEITAGIKAPRGVMGKTKYVLERIAMSADNAVRQAVYEASMQQPGITKAEALEKAFEIINFRRRGSSKMVNLIGQTVPFFYAYLSAQRVAYKTITGVGISPTERKAALETLAYTTAATMALSFIYAMANGGDDDYERTPSNVRDRSIVIPGTGGLRIPLRPDFFLFPKIIAEHTYHLMADNGFSDPAKFKKAMRDNFANAAFSPNVVPQIIKPTLEIGINYDFFQGKPIVGFFEQNKEASRQFSDSTSEFAKMMGGAGLSPQKVDHFVRGYFGTVGGLFLWGTNFFIEGEPGVPRPELSVSDMIATMPGVGAFKQKSTENALKVDFYELRDAIEKAKNTYDDMKIRSPEGLQTFLEDEKNLAKLAMEKGVTKIADHLSKIRRAIQQIAAAPEDRMSASEKEERIKELREVEMQMLKGINLKSLREQAKL